MTLEASIIRSIGLNMIQSIICLLIEGILWGIYVVLFAAALLIQRRRGCINLWSTLMFAVTLYLFTASTALFALNATWCFIKMKDILTINLEMDWDERRRNSMRVLRPLAIPMEALFLFNMLIGDIAVVIRTKILWGTGWRIVILPLVFLVTALAFSITSVICLSLSAFDNVSSIATGSYVCKRAEPIVWALSLLTNLVTTLLVAYRAWAHHKVIVEAFGPPRRRPGVEHVLELLVESGFVYFLFLLTQITLFLEAGSNSPARWAYSVLAAFGDQISGIYSTALIVLVVLKDDWAIKAPPVILGRDHR